MFRQIFGRLNVILSRGINMSNKEVGIYLIDKKKFKEEKNDK